MLLRVKFFQLAQLFSVMSDDVAVLPAKLARGNNGFGCDVVDEAGEADAEVSFASKIFVDPFQDNQDVIGTFRTHELLWSFAPFMGRDRVSTCRHRAYRFLFPCQLCR